MSVCEDARGPLRPPKCTAPCARTPERARPPAAVNRAAQGRAATRTAPREGGCASAPGRARKRAARALPCGFDAPRSRKRPRRRPPPSCPRQRGAPGPRGCVRAPGPRHFLPGAASARCRLPPAALGLWAPRSPLGAPPGAGPRHGQDLTPPGGSPPPPCRWRSRPGRRRGARAAPRSGFSAATSSSISSSRGRTVSVGSGGPALGGPPQGPPRTPPSPPSPGVAPRPRPRAPQRKRGGDGGDARHAVASPGLEQAAELGRIPHGAPPEILGSAQGRRCPIQSQLPAAPPGLEGVSPRGSAASSPGPGGPNLATGTGGTTGTAPRGGPAPSCHPLRSLGTGPGALGGVWGGSVGG